MPKNEGGTSPKDLKSMMDDLNSKSVSLSSEELWEVDNEVRKVMDKFREDYAVKEAQSITEANKNVIH
jgi:hypothetical protein